MSTSMPGLISVSLYRKLQSENDRLQSALSALTKAHHELGERAAKMRLFIEAMQWGDFESCVSCGTPNGGGHRTGCGLAELISAAPEPKRDVGEEIERLRGTVAALTSEAEARDKRDRNRMLAEASTTAELVKIEEMLTAAGVQSHWDRFSGIATSTRVRLLIERADTPPPTTSAEEGGT